jgi:sulfur-oxidizing protein SoxX
MTVVKVASALSLLAVAALASSAHADDLVAYVVSSGAIKEPLTSTPGNPALGRRIVSDLAHASCLICHAMPIPEEPDHGAIGPSLRGVGSRYSRGELRLRLVDPKAFNPDTIMPSYYRVSGQHRVQSSYAGRPIYSAQQVEDVVAYLASLKEK